MSRYLVAYDIADDGDRLRVASQLLARGVRLQNSVYEVDTRDVDELIAALRDLIDEDTDALLVTPVCAACQRGQREIGQAGPRLHERFWIA